MSKSVISIDGSISPFEWNLGNELGFGFEDYIFDTVSKYINFNYNNDVKVFNTTKSNDGGKDIIIKSNCDIKGLFNQNYFKCGKESITIYIECKSTNNGKLRFEKAIGSVAKIKELKIDYFILVTNSTITPYTFSYINNELSINHIHFCLVDQYVLLHFLQKCNTNIGDYIEPRNIPTFNAYYQTYTGIENGNKCFNLYLLCRNFSKFEHLGKIKLLTDRNWDSNITDLDFIIEPYGSYITKFKIKRAFCDGIDDLFFSLKIGEKETPLHIKSNYLSAEFETQLIGDSHFKCIDNFINWINTDNGLKIHYLWGEAGIGKTRVIDEIYKKANGNKYDFGFFKIGKNNVIKEVKRFLVNKRYIAKTESYSSLTHMLSLCKSEERRAILIFDDIHNADKSFINDIKSLSECIYPITIIVCGRTDYSAGSTDFFSFVQWCIENPNLNGFTLKAFTEDETKKLIKTIIDGLPSIVEDKLCKCSKNNPLYIVQFIEYLLEEKLVHLKNRNTVGISNISTFATRVYIPDEIHLLYKNRCNNLITVENGKFLYEFLLILSFLGGSISFEKTIRFFNEDMTRFSELVKRSFIKIDQNGLVSFIHESLYLFFNKLLNDESLLKSLVSKLISNEFAFFQDDLSLNDKGKLAVWRNDYSNAKICFSDTINELRTINNYSNINIDTKIYDYLYVIYKIFEKSNDADLLKNIILTRIYITLHYKAPINAITECDFAVEKTKNTKALADDKALYYTILEQKAHSMFHAGLLADGELILKELQIKWLLNKTDFDTATVFDMLDRLSGVYIKYNILDLAESYNKLSFRVSEQAKNNKIKIIAYLTESKINFYINPSKSSECIDKLLKLLSDEPSKRIECSAKISKLILNAVHNKNCNWNSCMNKALELLKIAITNGYTTSIIRAYMFLAVCAYKTEVSPIYETTRSFIAKGIDASIKFGVSTYIWQFYNFLGIVEMNLGFNNNHVYKTFMTSFSMLAKQNLLYLGSLELCYGNVLAISNVGFFLQSHNFESEFYKQMSKITYKNIIQLCDYDCEKTDCDFICNDSIKALKNEYKKAQNKDLLFSFNSCKYLLRDEKTNYFIVLS